MRRRIAGIASLFLGASVSVASPTETMPVVELQAQNAPDAPRVLPPASEEVPIPGPNVAPPPANFPTTCATCLPEPVCKFLPDPCRCCCKPAPRAWGSIEYLLWTIKDGPLDAPIFNLGPPTSGGVASAPGVRPLFGSDDLDFGAFNGARGEAGYWLNTAGTLGVDFRGFVLERGSEGFRANSGPLDPIAIGRSFVSTVNGAEAGALVTAPPAILGGAFGFASSRLWGFNADAVINVRDRSTYRIDALIGFEYLDLREQLTVGDTRFLAAAPALTVSTVDSFSTRNQFYGTDLGFKSTFKRGRLDFVYTFKVGLGATHEVSEVVGRTDAATPLGAATIPGGLLAVGSNSGRRARDQFACIPETELRLVYRLTEHFNTFVAYDFLYWSNVVRPGDQIDRVVNPLQVPVLAGGAPVPVPALVGPARPIGDLNSTDFFAHGLSLGIGMTF